MRSILSIALCLVAAAMVLLSALRCECIAASPISSIAAPCPCCCQKDPPHSTPIHSAVCLHCAGTLALERVSNPDLHPAAAHPLDLPFPPILCGCAPYASIANLTLDPHNQPQDAHTLLQLHCALTV